MKLDITKTINFIKRYNLIFKQLLDLIIIVSAILSLFYVIFGTGIDVFKLIADYLKITIKDLIIVFIVLKFVWSKVQ